MASLHVVDLNGSWACLGSIGTLSAQSTAITWFDLGNPGGSFPFKFRLGGNNPLSVSFEGTFNMTAQIVISLQDTTPASTPAGASTLAVPILQNISGTTSVFTSIDQNVRWIGLNCSSFGSGSGTGWVYGLLPV
jgi:hypothetical protein